jgi:hypothetical protein
LKFSDGVAIFRLAKHTPYQKKRLLSEEILGIRKPRARSLLDVNEELSVEYNVKFTA